MWIILFCGLVPVLVSSKTVVFHHGRTTGIFQLENKGFAKSSENESINNITDYNFFENTTSKNLTNIEIIMEDIIFCNLTVADGDQKKKLLESFYERHPVIHLDFISMLSAVSKCETFTSSRFITSTTTTTTTTPAPFWNIFSGISSGIGGLLSGSLFSGGIVPGTKWCGINDIAGGYDELGEDWQLDQCCRAHDHCPIKVKSFSNKFGLYNILSPYTKSHCSCDEVFYDCLKAVDTKKADNIGNVFFNVLAMQCLEMGLPPICEEYRYFYQKTTSGNFTKEEDNENDCIGEDKNFLQNFTDLNQNNKTDEVSSDDCIEEDMNSNQNITDLNQNNNTVGVSCDDCVKKDIHSIQNSTDLNQNNKTIEVSCEKKRKCLKWIPDVTKNPRLMFVKKKISF